MSAFPIKMIFSSQYQRECNICSDYFYRFERYDINFSVAIFYSESTLDPKVFEMHIRQSDRLIKIQDNLFCVVLDVTSHEEGLKASENIFASYEAGHFSQKLYVSLVNAKEFSTTDALKAKLFALLDTAIKEDIHYHIHDGCL